jgi:hypothetical protein
MHAFLYSIKVSSSEIHELNKYKVATMVYNTSKRFASNPNPARINILPFT